MQADVGKKEKELQLMITACLSVLILGTGIKLDAYE